MRVERKVGVAGDGEAVHGERVEHLGRLDLAGQRARGADLGKAVRDEEDEDYEEAIGGPLDLEVAEEGVGAEEVEGLVDNVCFGGIGWVGGGVRRCTGWVRGVYATRYTHRGELDRGTWS